MAGRNFSQDQDRPTTSSGSQAEVSEHFKEILKTIAETGKTLTRKLPGHPSHKAGKLRCHICEDRGCDLGPMDFRT